MPRICFNLVFDPETERSIRDVRRSIADQRVAVKGLNGYRPHITLAVYDVDEVEPYAEVLAPLVAALAPFPVLLESLGLFPEEGVIFLAPRMSQQLFSLHRSVFDTFATLDGSKRPTLVSKHHMPDLWVPHATLAGSLTAKQVLKGVGDCLSVWSPIRGSIVGIGVRIFPEMSDYRQLYFV